MLSKKKKKVNFCYLVHEKSLLVFLYKLDGDNVKLQVFIFMYDVDTIVFYSVKLQKFKQYQF